MLKCLTSHTKPNRVATGGLLGESTKPDHRITESLRLGKTSEIIKFSLHPNTSIPTKPCHKVDHGAEPAKCTSEHTTDRSCPTPSPQAWLRAPLGARTDFCSSSSRIWRPLSGCGVSSHSRQCCCRDHVQPLPATSTLSPEPHLLSACPTAPKPHSSATALHSWGIPQFWGLHWKRGADFEKQTPNFVVPSSVPKSSGRVGRWAEQCS